MRSQLDRMQRDFQDDKTRLEDQMYEAQARERKRENEVEDLRDQLASLQEENERVKLSLVNKDSKNASLEEMIRLERERREGESGELRNLLMVEREKSLQAAREAEKFATEINIHKREAERAVNDLDRKRERVDELERLLLEAKVGKGRSDTMEMFKWESKQAELEAKHKDELSSVQLRLANRESDIYKME